MQQRPVPATLRNARLLAQSAVQHLVDDPALLAVQVSRRLPFAMRVRAGKALRAVAARVPAGAGAEALGAFMSGDESGAERIILAADGRGKRLRGEVSVLLGRLDLVRPDAPARTRARAAWSRGDMSQAVRILETAGLGESAYARRLRSELHLLQPGVELEGSTSITARFAPRAEGEPLRVLHLLTNSLPHTQSGYSLRTHRVLTALAQRGVESVALTRTGYPVMVGKAAAHREDLVDGIRYLRSLPGVLAATPQGRLEQEVAEAQRVADEFRPHVLHATTDYRNALVAQAVSRATGIPWVLEVRGLMEQTWIASHRSASEREAARASEKVRLVAAREGELAAAAGAVVTLSRTMAEELEARGVPAERITIVPNGVDASLLEDHVSPAQARREIGLDLPAGAFVVGAVSALVEYEGFDVLLRAVAQLLHDESTDADLRARLHVLLAGDGTAKPALQQLARDLGIEDRLIAPGRVPRGQARRWVEALDVVVVPRLDREVTRAVTPQKPVEAMALGRPVIVSDLPALREAAPSNGHAADVRYVSAGDPSELARAVTDRFAADLPTSEALDGMRRYAATRSWTSLSGCYASAYAELLVRRSEEGARGE